MRFLAVLLLLVFLSGAHAQDTSIRGLDTRECFIVDWHDPGTYFFKAQVIGPGIMNVSVSGNGTLYCPQCCLDSPINSICRVKVEEAPYLIKVCNVGSCAIAIEYSADKSDFDGCDCLIFVCLCLILILGVVFIILMKRKETPVVVAAEKKEKEEKKEKGEKEDEVVIPLSHVVDYLPQYSHHIPDYTSCDNPPPYSHRYASNPYFSPPTTQ